MYLNHISAPSARLRAGLRAGLGEWGPELDSPGHLCPRPPGPCLQERMEAQGVIWEGPTMRGGTGVSASFEEPEESPQTHLTRASPKPAPGPPPECSPDTHPDMNKAGRGRGGHPGCANWLDTQSPRRSQDPGTQSALAPLMLKHTEQEGTQTPRHVGSLCASVGPICPAAQEQSPDGRPQSRPAVQTGHLRNSRPPHRHTGTERGPIRPPSAHVRLNARQSPASWTLLTIHEAAATLLQVLRLQAGPGPGRGGHLGCAL